MCRHANVPLSSQTKDVSAGHVLRAHAAFAAGLRALLLLNELGRCASAMALPAAVPLIVPGQTQLADEQLTWARSPSLTAFLDMPWRTTLVEQLDSKFPGR
jgi:hypothetical protein